MKKSKDNKKFNAILSMLAKFNVNLPLLELIDNVLAYARFFKDLNASKRNYMVNEKLVLPEIANSMVGMLIK